jgi:hypothetical protein
LNLLPTYDYSVRVRRNPKPISSFTKDMNARQNQLELISKRVEQANDKITEIMNKLGWTRQDLIQWRKVKLVQRFERDSANVWYRNAKIC